MSDIDPELGIRRLTAGNWLVRDATGVGSGYVSELVGPVIPDADGWARKFLSVELDLAVPAVVRELFAVARGCMLYGWFFYPLYALGEEQVFRVLDAAAYHCHAGLAGPPSNDTYFKRIEWLADERIVPAGDRERWHAARMLRNSVSHATRRAAFPPGGALEQLEAAAWDINAIFRRAQAQPRWRA